MREIYRQSFHLLLGLGIAALVLLAGTPAAAILAVVLLAGLLLIDLVLAGYTIPLISPLLVHLDRPGPLPGRGALFYVASALACVIIFPARVAVPALVALAVLDSIATIAGKRYGRHRVANGKSWEGTLAGMAVTSLALLPFLTVPGAVLASILAGVIELVSPVDDNLVIPAGVSILLTALPVLLL